MKDITERLEESATSERGQRIQAMMLEAKSVIDGLRTHVEALERLADERLSKLQACEKELKDKHEAYEIAVMQAMENGARANGYADRLEVVSKEVEAMEALLEKATNDVSAWRTRATSAESRLDRAEKILRDVVDDAIGRGIGADAEKYFRDVETSVRKSDDFVEACEDALKRF